MRNTMLRVTQVRPKKGRIFRGKKRLAKNLVGSKWDILVWAANRKVGDYIYSLEGCNRKIAKIKYMWRNEGRLLRGKVGKTWVITDVIFYDTNGVAHSAGWRASMAPKSNDAITKYWLDVANSNCQYNNWRDDKPKQIIMSNLLLDEWGEFRMGSLTKTIFGLEKAA